MCGVLALHSSSSRSFGFFFPPFRLCDACTLRGITCGTERGGDRGASSFTYMSNFLEVVLHGGHGCRARVVSSKSQMPGEVEKTSTSASSVNKKLEKKKRAAAEEASEFVFFFFLFSFFLTAHPSGDCEETNLRSSSRGDGGNNRDDVSSKSGVAGRT